MLWNYLIEKHKLGCIQSITSHKPGSTNRGSQDLGSREQFSSSSPGSPHRSTPQNWLLQRTGISWPTYATRMNECIHKGQQLPLLFHLLNRLVSSWRKQLTIQPETGINFWGYVLRFWTDSASNWTFDLSGKWKSSIIHVFDTLETPFYWCITIHWI